MISWSTYSSLTRESSTEARAANSILLLRSAYFSSSLRLQNYEL